MADGIVHIAGSDIRFGSHLRQRCVWCFAVLIDEDLIRIAVPVDQLGPDGTFTLPTWPVGGLVEVSGGNPKCSAALEPEVCDDGSIYVPERCCIRLPAEMTVAP